MYTSVVQYIRWLWLLGWLFVYGVACRHLDVLLDDGNLVTIKIYEYEDEV